MYIPQPQAILTTSLGFLNAFTNPTKVTSGSCLDYEVQQCLDSSGNIRCSKPFLATEGQCYNIHWSTDGLLSHTTAEIRDAGSGELVYYRDTDGEWTPDKGELVYLDFMPKIVGQGNKSVEFTVMTCV